MKGGFYVLNNTKKAIANRNLTIGYFGGSITEGAGASNVKLCWREMLTDWFKIIYPETKIHEINAAIGGTGSDLGAFRAGHDLLIMKPDLVFLEFAVNDYALSKEEIITNTKRILSAIYEKNDCADIVIIITYNKAVHDDILNKGFCTSVDAYKEAGKMFGLHVINAGQEIGNLVEEKCGTWKDYTIDFTHPNDMGYNIYFEKISRDILKIIALSEEKYQRHDAKGMTDGRFYIKDSWDTEVMNGFEKCSRSLAGRYEHTIISENAGESIELEFTGSQIMLYYMIGPKTGKMTYSVDGEPKKELIMWDKYSHTSERAGYKILYDNLENKKHRLIITNIGEPEDQKRQRTQIGAFLIFDKEI